MAFGIFDSLGTPAYEVGADSSDPSGYMAGLNKRPKAVIVVGIIVIVALLLIVFGVIGLRASGEIVI